MAPDSIQKVLANIRKTQERAKRKKKEAKPEDEEADKGRSKARPERWVMGDVEGVAPGLPCQNVFQMEPFWLPLIFL
jgi:hypothetical protein